MVLGSIELRANRLSDALVHLERGASQAPDDFIVQSTYGRGLVMQMSGVRTIRKPPPPSCRAPGPLCAGPRKSTRSPHAPRGCSPMWSWSAGAMCRVRSRPSSGLSSSIPSREEYRLLLAQAQIRQGEYHKATALLGPIMAAGRTADTRAEARRVMTDVGNIRAAREAGAAPPSIRFVAHGVAGDAARAGSARRVHATPIDEARLAELRSQAGRAGLQLRPVAAGSSA